MIYVCLNDRHRLVKRSCNFIGMLPKNETSYFYDAHMYGDIQIYLIAQPYNVYTMVSD